MTDTDERFEQDFSGHLRTHARTADRPMDFAAVASRAMAGGASGGSRFALPPVLRGVSGVAWAGLVIGLLVVSVAVLAVLGGRPSVPVPVVTSPSPSPSSSASPSAAASPSASASPAPSASPTPTAATPAPTPSPTASPVPSATPVPAATPSAPPSTAAPSPTAGAAMPPGFQPLSVTFVSAGEGWVLGTCGAATCPVIGHTLDAGRHWTQVAVPPTTVSTDPATTGIQSIRFASPRDGWAYGPELWSTHDGGGSWTRVTLPGLGVDSAVVALEAARGLAHAVAYDGQTNFRILTTASDADDWKLDKLELPVGAGPVPSVQLVLSGQAGWILQNDRVVVNGARLVGGTWQTWAPVCADVLGPAYLAASSAQDLVAACDVGAFSAPQGGHVFVSHDGGLTFTAVGTKLPFTLGGAIATPGTSTIVMGGEPPSKGVGLYASFDGGVTWSAVLALGNGAVGYVGFTTADQGVMVGASSPGPAMFMSRDGGHTWDGVTF